MESLLCALASGKKTRNEVRRNGFENRAYGDVWCCALVQEGMEVEGPAESEAEREGRKTSTWDMSKSYVGMLQAKRRETMKEEIHAPERTVL